MLLTEGYAKTQWCPETRVVGFVNAEGHDVLTGNTASNSDLRNAMFSDTRCKGVGCMMWRWSDQHEGRHRLGYCGKAGPAIA